VAIGTEEQILDYLKTKNILSSQKGFHIQKIKHLLNERNFFDKAIAILREREVYSQDAWWFGLVHKDELTIKELLMLGYNGGGTIG
jgi:DNA-binding transcriptional MerR regulator